MVDLNEILANADMELIKEIRALNEHMGNTRSGDVELTKEDLILLDSFGPPHPKEHR